MSELDPVIDFYRRHVPDGVMEAHQLVAPCPFCKAENRGSLRVDLDPNSLFFGCFGCSALCSPSGFALEFARRRTIAYREVPGFDPDREEPFRPPTLPHTHRDTEMHQYARTLSAPMREPFLKVAIKDAVLDLMLVGFNGRMFTFPYLQHDGHCYAIRCVAFGARFSEALWQGTEALYVPPHNLFNIPDVARADGGTLFVTVGEHNALALAQAGYPVVAIPTPQDDEAVTAERLALVRHVLVAMDNNTEGRDAARRIAQRLGYKVRILSWSLETKKNLGLADVLAADPSAFQSRVREMIELAEPLSPLCLARREYAAYEEEVSRRRGQRLLGLETCFPKLNDALDGLRGLNILGSQPKTGKSTFFMQLATSLAIDQQLPVIYYDFENGRAKIYTRTLCRLARVSERDLTLEEPPEAQSKAVAASLQRIRRMLDLFKVVSDRKINPDVMRKQIEFLRLDTGRDRVLLVIDSLHKLPFSRLSERRSGIDEWLRNFEQIRDEMGVTFLVVSELSRSLQGGYDELPNLGSFKESGDIEYTADNALIMTTEGSVYDRDGGDAGRTVHLWLVASREMSPGKVADYQVEFPYWSFREIATEISSGTKAALDSGVNGVPMPVRAVL